MRPARVRYPVAVNIEQLISARALSMSGSGIRRAFELGAKLARPINLSIGQPDFPVPDPIKAAAIRAIQADHNGYSLSRGVAPLQHKLADRLHADLGWTFPEATPSSSSAVMVTSGTSGGLILACLALLNPGDEIVIPDPYFVLYPALAALTDAKAVRCNTYPDFRLTAARVEKCLSPRTKIVLLNSPSNPAGVVNTAAECADLLDLCRRRGLLLISDEIYDEFAFPEARTQSAVLGGPGLDGRRFCASPARLPGAAENVLVIRGFGKTYGCTGWRLGYAAGPRALIEQMVKLQQFSFVCAPTPLQHAGVAALDFDMTSLVAEYAARRDLVMQRLAPITPVPLPGGAFYAFVPIPPALGLSGAQFMEKAIARNVIIVNGGTFSDQDTHFRLSFARPRPELDEGLTILVDLLSGPRRSP